MIYTVTFNPAIDYIAGVEELKMNGINRAISEKILAGGKGINVSIVLKNLGIESVALGFIAGFTGKEIQSRVEQFGIKTDFFPFNRHNANKVFTKFFLSIFDFMHITTPLRLLFISLSNYPYYTTLPRYFQ